MARRRYRSSFTFWRFTMPSTIAILIAVTLAASIVNALGNHLGFSLARWCMFVPERVWHGEVWRLVSYIWFEVDPISLVFGVLAIYWFGSELCDYWGWRKFVLAYVGIAGSAALVTCLIARFVWHAPMDIPHVGNWPVIDALIICYAVAFPTREINMYFFFPIGGRALIAMVVGGTVLFAIYYGMSGFIPHFAAEGLVLLSSLSLRRWWLQIKQSRLKKQMRRYVDNVRRIDGKDDDDEDEPPPRKWVN
jgi:membrane associated rhomboid family serine protease